MAINRVNKESLRDILNLILALCLWIYSSSLTYATNIDNLEEDGKVVRSHFRECLTQIKNQVYQDRLSRIQERYNVFTPTIFISYAWEDDIKLWVAQVLSKDLEALGFQAFYDQTGILAGHEISEFEWRVSMTTYVVALCTPKYRERYLQHAPNTPDKSTGVGREMERIVHRLENPYLKNTVLPIYRKGTFNDCAPPSKLKDVAAFEANTDKHYYNSFFILAQSLFLSEQNDAQPIEGIKEQFLAFQAQYERDKQSPSFCLPLETVETLFTKAAEIEKKGDLEQAFTLYSQAASHKHVLAQAKVRYFYHTRRGIFSKQPLRDAFNKYHMQAGTGDAVAGIILGWMYRDGFGTAPNEQKAFRLLKIYADRGYAIPQNNIGWMYEEGRGVDEDEKMAMVYYEMAAKQDYVVALHNVGTLCERRARKNGKESAHWYSEAATWYRDAAQKGYADSQYKIGWLSEEGLGVQKSETEALKWYTIAAKQGHTEAEEAVRRFTKKGGSLLELLPIPVSWKKT